MVEEISAECFGQILYIIPGEIFKSTFEEISGEFQGWIWKNLSLPSNGLVEERGYIFPKIWKRTYTRSNALSTASISDSLKNGPIHSYNDCRKTQFRSFFKAFTRNSFIVSLRQFLRVFLVGYAMFSINSPMISWLISGARHFLKKKILRKDL